MLRDAVDNGFRRGFVEVFPMAVRRRVRIGRQLEGCRVAVEREVAPGIPDDVGASARIDIFGGAEDWNGRGSVLKVMKGSAPTPPRSKTEIEEILESLCPSRLCIGLSNHPSCVEPFRH